jgi:D-glycero-beta-D-manno-heptose 1-phosphate adenylyltransferase
MPEKIMTPQTLPGILQNRQRKGERVVFTNGCFDLLHIGHIRYLQAARALGDLLVVAVNSDDSVRSLAKGPGRPLIPVAQRMEVLAALTCVDYVLQFDEPTPLKVIETLQPDVLVKGGDWAVDHIVGKDVVEGRGGTVQNIALIPDVSTSLIIERIQHMNVNTDKSQTIEARPTSLNPSLPDPTKTS